MISKYSETHTGLHRRRDGPAQHHGRAITPFGGGGTPSTWVYLPTLRHVGTCVVSYFAKLLGPGLSGQRACSSGPFCGTGLGPPHDI